MKKFLTPNEVMQEMGISYATLLRRVKKKEIPFIKIGKGLRFPGEYFEQLQNQAMQSVKGAE